MSGPINIVVPFKDPPKRRLAGVLDGNQRRALARALLDQTLLLLRQHLPDHHRLIVTNTTVRWADRHGAAVLREVPGHGLNGAVAQAARWSVDRGFASMLVLPADIAAIDPAELEFLMARPRPRPSLHLCPADDGGTNALLATPPDAVGFHYGEASCAAHAAAARRAGVPATLHRLPSLAHDVDTPDDLAALISGPRSPAGALVDQWRLARS